MRKLCLIFVLLLCAGSISAQPLGATPALCGGPPDPGLALQDPLHVKLFGVVEDSGNTEDCPTALAKAKLAASSGFNTVRILIRYGPGFPTPKPETRPRYVTAVQAYQSQGLTVIVNVSPDWNRRPNLHMPLQPHDRVQFATFVAAWAHLLPTVRLWSIGMEPNSGHFWYPQCTPDGQGDSPLAYSRIMALSYDALHKAEFERPGGLSLAVIGGELSSHGEEDPGSKCVSRSPANFVSEWGRAYRDSGRQEPEFDILGYHPYGETNQDSPFQVHAGPEIGFNDYDRLRSALCKGFAGTAQSCKVPVLYSEYGVQTVTPSDKLYLYSGKENVETVGFPTAVKFNLAAIHFGSCQRGVMGVMLFLLQDEPDLDGWQSGLFYAQDPIDPSAPPEPKPSQAPISEALLDAKAGLTSCSSR
jgi:hypothetical protein